MLQRRRRKDNISPKSHPSLTFINNLLHSKSTYFYKWWGEKKSSKLTYSYLVPSVCILALLVGVYGLINPTISLSTERVQAIKIDNGDGDPVGGTGDSPITPSIKLTMGDDIKSQEIVKVNEVGYISNNFTVEASNISKYYITVQAASGYDSNLVGLTSRETVRGVGSNKTPDNFGSNTWGYNITDNTTADNSTLTYSTVPDSANAMATAYETNTTGMVNAGYKLTFAAKLGEDKPTDHYQSQVLLSVASEPGEVVEALGLGGVTTMQDFTSTLCKQLDIGETGVLEDRRLNNDGKTRRYVIMKMPDDNCWMTQNLDYDGGGDRVTNLADWQYSSDPDIARYYDPGDWVYQYDDANNAYRCDTKVGLSECTTKGWEQVSSYESPYIDSAWTTTYNNGFVFASNYVGTDGQTVCSKERGSLLGDMTRNVCKIYYYKYALISKRQQFHVGNYYSWFAANSGVCPSNWTMPVGSNVNGSGSLYYLLNKVSVLDGTITTNNPSIMESPLFFVPGGDINAGSISMLGSYGNYWTSTAYDSLNGYRLYFDSQKVATFPISNAQYQYQSKYFGFPVRCLVKSN